MLNDLRSILRGLRREPRFAALAVLTFALGIGAATAIFTVVNRVVLRPVPYPNPDRIVYFGWSWIRGGRTDFLSARKFQFWRDETHLFDGVASYESFTGGLSLGQTETDISGLRVSSDFFRVLGARPLKGRAFAPDGMQPSAPRVAILSYGLWQSRYGLDPHVLDQRVRIDGQIYIIVGVMPATFRIAETADQPQVLLPLVLTESELATKGYDYLVVGRLKPRVSLGQARADVASVMPQFRTAYPSVVETNDKGVVLIDYRDRFVGGLQAALWVLFGAAGFVLMLTCANVANLLLARAMKRRREIAIRAALGATHGRILRLFITEGVVIGLLAAGVGVAISVWGLHALLGLAPGMLPVSDEPRPDAWVLAFSASLALLTGGLIGVAHAVPTLETHRYQGRLPGTLIAIESALAIVLLTGAGLLTTSLARVLAVDSGFVRTGVLMARVPRAPAGYDSAAAVWNFDQRVLARLRTMPGVVRTASASAVPMEGGNNLPITADGNPDQSLGTVWWRAVSPQYFETLGITLVHGRDFAETDRMGAPGVIIISKSLADKFWPGADPIGHRVDVGQYHGKPFTADEPTREIIGVAADTRQLGLTYEAPPILFVPQAQVPAALVSIPRIMVRMTSTGVASASIAQAIGEADPRMPPPRFQTIDQLVADSVEPDRFNATLMGLFAALALIVTCIGIYGVASYAVASRTRDIGIRMALGAPAHRVVALVIRQGMLPVLIGSVAGLALALVLARLMTGLIYGVSARDPVTLAIVSIVLTGVALIGNWLPARKAARIDPLITLRGD